MRAMCPERDRLWTQYDEALARFIAAVDQANNGVPPSTFAAENASREVASIRAAIREHCEQHGCDPDWLRLEIT
jgi:hypothetical protein